MNEWFSSLEIFSQFYWIVALIGSLFFLFIVVMTFLGADAGEGLDDLDAGVEADIGIEFQFITFKNLIGFFTLFGWSGIACLDAGLSKTVTVIISLISGLLMMAVMAAMFHYMKKLTASGTLNYKNAIGAVGEVYLTIPANRAKIGKVSITIQGSLRELEALTDSNSDLKSGAVISVLDVTNNGILIVDSHKNTKI